MYKYAAITRTGVRREKNEDRVMIAGNYLSDGELLGEVTGPLLAVVCDGVGGEAFGDEAAEITSMSFLPLCKTELSLCGISSAVLDAGRTVRLMQNQNAAHRYMASTLAGIHISGNKYTAFNVGDSRVYSYKSGKLIQLSRDHRIMQHTLTRCVGGHGDRDAASFKNGNAEKSSFMLCSDGAFDKTPENVIAEIISNPVPVIEKCRAIFGRAIKNGSADDISIVLIEMS